VGALNALGTAEANLGHWEAAEKYFREGVEVLHQNQDNALYGFFLLCLGVTVAARGDHAAGRAYFQRSLELCNLHGDRQYSLYALLFNTEDLFLQGQVKTALELSHQALLSTEEMGHRHVLPRCLVNLARATMLQGDYARARDWARKIDPVEKALGGNGKGTLIILTMIDLYDSQLEAARAKGLEALALARQEKDLYELFNTLFKACLNLARVSLKRLDLDNARKYVGEAEKLYPEIVWHKDDATYLLVQTLAHTARLEGQRQEALRLYQENLRQMLKAGHLLYAPESLEGLAMAEVEEGQLVLAAHLLGRAHALREQMGTPLPPCSQEAYAVYQARLQQAAPPEELERLWSEGQNMTVEEALAEALKIGERQPL
jgi:tetratricopeptide (TPR) repeat protein